MAKGKYYTPEFKEQAVKMVVGLDCTYDVQEPAGQRPFIGRQPCGRRCREHG
jgi:hypothetical protein